MADPTFPSPNDEAGPAAWIVSQQRAAQSSALQGLDANADDGARAIELGKATGVDPAIVHGNLEQFEQQHKATLTAGLLQNNQFLRDYANSSSMAPIVSNDDWGQLDSVSQAVSRLPKMQALHKAGSILEKGAEDFMSGFGRGGWGSSYIDMEKADKELQGHPGATAATALMVLAGIPAEAVFRTTSGLLSGATGMVGEAAHQMGAPKEGVEDAKDKFLQTIGDPGLWASLGPVGEMIGQPLEVMAHNAKLASAVKAISEVHQAVAPFVEHGVEPPVGVHSLVDQVKSEQTKLDMKNLDEAVKEAGKSSTRERAPDLFEDFIKQHTDAKIGIDAEAVRKLYGDKQPEPGDNILGDVPGLADQLTLAEAHGGDVEVPLSHWLAKVEPEVAKELHDFIRVRPGGMTLEEAKAPKVDAAEEAKPAEGEAIPTPEVTPVDTLRTSAGLSPKALPAPAADIAAQGRSFIPDNAVTDVNIQLDDNTSIHSQATFPAKDILSKIDPEGLNPLPKEVFTFLKPFLNKLAGDVDVHVVSKADMDKLSSRVSTKVGAPGMHVLWGKDFREIFLRDDVASGRMGESYAAHIIVHEIAHGATVKAMEDHPELKTGLVALAKEAYGQFSAEDKKEHSYAFFGGGKEFSPEEFIAEAYSKQSFQEALAATKMSPELAKALHLGEGPKTLWDAFREMVRGVLEKVIGAKLPNSILDGVLQIGKIIEQVEGKGEAEAGPKASAAEPPAFDRPAALGMNKERAERYRKLIEKQQGEDADFQRSEGEREERERQTKEWKENYSRVREETSADLRSRPDLAADRFLRTGELYDEKSKKVKLASSELTAEQKAALPKDYLAADGIHPDDLGGLFGYSSGDQLVSALGRLEAERQMEGLTAQAHFSKLVDAETDRAMRKQYGDLDENILEAAKEHVLGNTQLDILHEEMVALGEKAGGAKAGAISKADIKAWVKAEFDKQPLSAHSSSKYLAAAGRAGQATEDALLADKPSEAYKAKQQQVIAIHLAQMAKRLEKETAAYDRLAKRYSKREIGGISPQFTNWVHDILMRTGNTVRRSVNDLQDAIGRESHNTLEAFVNEHNHDARIWEVDNDAPSDFEVMPVAPFLFDPAYRKPTEDMTPPEFRAVVNSVKTLVKNGQEENKIGRLGDKQELKDVVGKMVGQLQTLFSGKERQYAFGHVDKGPIAGIRTYLASLLQIESIFNRFDRGDSKGVFHQFVTRPIFDGSHELNTLETRYSREYRELKFEKADLKRKVDNNLFSDPLRDGEKAPMTRGNLLAVLQNVGNQGQLEKLAKGYGIKDPAQVMQWLFANTKKEDWDRAQKLGDIFERAFDESATMYHNLSGVAPEKIDIRPIQTPFGEYKGWYHPIVYDPLRPGSSKKLMGTSPLEDGSYYRAATPSGYTKRRTGYAAPIQLNFEAIPNRLKSMLNDIAMRPAVSEVAKVFYDKDFQMALTKYYGKEIKDLMIPYLKDIAGMAQSKEAANSVVGRYLEYARQNISATLIGLNPSTVMKHGPTAAMLSVKEVGAAPFLRELKGLLSMNDELGEKNWSFAMKGGIVNGSEWHGSEELQRRHRNWQETLTGAQADVFGENTLRQTVIKFGATPVAFSDLLSAVPTWLAAYKDQIRSGESHGDAVAFADTAVRRAHGSSAVAAKPALMRSPIGRWVAPFYTFFNEMLQRQYEMAWRAKDMLGQFNEGEYKEGLKQVPNLMGGLWAYVVFPALIEQAVSPLITGQESTTEKVAAYGARTLASGIPVLRDAIEAFLGGRDPTVGLYSTGIKMLTDAVKDIPRGKQAFDKQHAGNTIRHTVTAFGAISGLTNAQEGRTGEYVYNVATGKERPKNTSEILRGLWHGQSKEPKR